jgi:hypothetical protein
MSRQLKPQELIFCGHSSGGRLTQPKLRFRNLNIGGVQMAIIDSLKIRVEGRELQLTGGSFYEMLDAVKAIQGRRWDGDSKVWVLPSSLVECRETALAEYQIVGDEEELLETEIQEIQRLQSILVENLDFVTEKKKELEAQRDNYSFHSKSRIKASIATNAACLGHAISNAQKPVEELVEIDIRGMKRAVEMLEL